MRLVNRLYIGLLLTASAAFAQYPIPGSSGGGGGGGGCTAGTGITCVGSTISVDTAVIQSRATAQSGASTYCRSTTGNDTYTCALTPTLTAYTTGSCLVLNADTANTGAATINVDALGVKSILNRSGAALAAGDIPLNKPVGICYDGTQWIVQGGQGTVYTLISTSGPVSDPGGPSTFQYNNAAGALTFNAPAGVAGYQRCYRNSTTRTGVITIQMAASNTVDVDGSNGTSAGTLVSGGALGDAVCIVSDATNHWYAYIQKGTWTNN